jgi:hypothetical protein
MRALRPISDHRSTRRARAAIAAGCLAIGIACGRPDSEQSLTAAERATIAETLHKRVIEAYDLTKPNVVENLVSLYPDSGRVISATAGAVTASRDTLVAGIRSFWENVGRNMKNPTWQWGPFYTDVLSRDAAVVTTTYRVPHLTPQGQPHVIAGAWTMVWQRRGGRWVIVQEHLSDLPPAQAMAGMSGMPGM